MITNKTSWSFLGLAFIGLTIISLAGFAWLVAPQTPLNHLFTNF